MFELRSTLTRIADPIARIVLVLASGCFVVAAAQAQSMTAAQADTLIQQNREVLDELKQIRKLLDQQSANTARAPSPTAPVDEKVSMPLAPGGFALGSADAPITLVEYTDYQCPFCRQFHLNVFEEIKRQFIDTGKVRFLSRDFPLDMHENATRAAVAGRCAAEQGKYWQMRQVMIVNADRLQAQNLPTYAADLGLDVGRFNACLASGKYQGGVAADLAEGRRAGVSGTPSFVLGRVSNDTIDGVRIVGALPYATFEARLQEMLSKVSPN